MAWLRTRQVQITDDALDRRIRDLELGMIIGRTRPQWTGERTEHVKWQIIKAAFNTRLPWEA